MRGAYETPSEKCPYCGSDVEADWVDVGVGMVQAGPYHCDECGATECGAYDTTPDDLARRDPATGWFRPDELPGSTANMINGRLASVEETQLMYRLRFSGPDGARDHATPGVVDAWRAAHRLPVGKVET